MISHMWNLRKSELMETKNRLVVARDKGYGGEEMSECGQKVHISSFKTDKFWKENGQHGDYS